MGLFDKAKSYREKLIIESLKGESDFFLKRPVTFEDLKILKEYYERSISTSPLPTAKFGLLNLLLKVVEDVKYFSSVEGIVSSAYTVFSRLGYDVEGIGYITDKLDVIYGSLEEKEIPAFFGVSYYFVENGSTFFKITGEMGTFLVVKCRGEKQLEEDTEMVLRKCIDILSTALRLIQFRGFDIRRFWGYRNSFLLSQIYLVATSDHVNEKDKTIMLAYYLKELFGLNSVVFFEETGNTLKPKMAFDFPLEILGPIKISPDVFGRNISSLEVVDLELSKLFSYGSSNIAFLRIKGQVLCIGANYDLSFVISMASNL